VGFSPAHVLRLDLGAAGFYFLLRVLHPIASTDGSEWTLLILSGFLITGILLDSPKNLTIFPISMLARRVGIVPLISPACDYGDLLPGFINSCCPWSF